jgi:hypothetical protein
MSMRCLYPFARDESGGAFAEYAELVEGTERGPQRCFGVELASETAHLDLSRIYRVSIHSPTWREPLRIAFVEAESRSEAYLKIAGVCCRRWSCVSLQRSTGVFTRLKAPRSAPLKGKASMWSCAYSRSAPPARTSRNRLSSC